MFGLFTRVALVVSSCAAMLSDSIDAADDAHTLPVIFIHGLTANATYGRNLQANLSTDARPFVALTSCESACTSKERNYQVQLHIAKIRELVASDPRFAKGYSLIGHSQGGALARSVIEEMDDHKVHTFISLAGAGNGVFYGPQENDFIPAQTFLRMFAPLGDPKVFDYSKYTDADIRSGKLQVDLIKFQSSNPQYDSQLTRSPVKSDWITYNKFLPRLNNLQNATGNATLAAEIARRKANFLKIKEAHFFGSQFDETISPWQSALNGQYNDVASLADLESGYSKLTVIPMEETPEYTQDLYGLQTLDKRGGLFLHSVPNVSHECWVQDFLSPRTKEICKFMPVYEKTVYPLLAPLSASVPVKGHC